MSSNEWCKARACIQFHIEIRFSGILRFRWQLNVAFHSQILGSRCNSAPQNQTCSVRLFYTPVIQMACNFWASCCEQSSWILHKNAWQTDLSCFYELQYDCNVYTFSLTLSLFLSALSLFSCFIVCKTMFTIKVFLLLFFPSIISEFGTLFAIISDHCIRCKQCIAEIQLDRGNYFCG